MLSICWQNTYSHFYKATSRLVLERPASFVQSITDPGHVRTLKIVHTCIINTMNNECTCTMNTCTLYIKHKKKRKSQYNILAENTGARVTCIVCDDSHHRSMLTFFGHTQHYQTIVQAPSGDVKSEEAGVRH